jgi:hypothetical protein
MELEDICPPGTGVNKLIWNWSKTTRQELEQTLSYGAGGYPHTWKWSKKPHLELEQIRSSEAGANPLAWNWSKCSYMELEDIHIWSKSTYPKQEQTCLPGTETNPLIGNRSKPALTWNQRKSAYPELKKPAYLEQEQIRLPGTGVKLFSRCCVWPTASRYMPAPENKNYGTMYIKEEKNA